VKERRRKVRRRSVNCRKYDRRWRRLKKTGGQRRGPATRREAEKDQGALAKKSGDGRTARPEVLWGMKNPDNRCEWTGAEGGGRPGDGGPVRQAEPRRKKGTPRVGEKDACGTAWGKGKRSQREGEKSKMARSASAKRRRSKVKGERWSRHTS